MKRRMNNDKDHSVSQESARDRSLRERRSPLRISFYVGSSHCTKSAKWARGESIPRTRITLALLSRLFNWRDALIVVQPKTLIRWHRAGFRLLWYIGRQLTRA